MKLPKEVKEILGGPKRKLSKCPNTECFWRGDRVH